MATEYDLRLRFENKRKHLLLSQVVQTCFDTRTVLHG
jgi:hypothetical protein